MTQYLDFRRVYVQEKLGDQEADTPERNPILSLWRVAFNKAKDSLAKRPMGLNERKELITETMMRNTLREVITLRIF